jgi:hypothetical protein
MVDGCVDLQRKCAVSLTKRKRSATSSLYSNPGEKMSKQKKNIGEYRKTLTGQIEYEVPNANLNSFRGFLKLKIDPKNEALTIDNLLVRGSTLMNTEWLATN